MQPSAHPLLAPADDEGAEPAPAMLGVHVAVDGDRDVRAVEHVRVGGEAPVWRLYGYGLFGERDVMPVAEQLLDGHPGTVADGEPALGYQVRHGLRVADRGHPGSVAVRQRREKHP
jgi:hypothetical protein